MKKRLLLIGPLPPPFAGPEVGTRMLMESSALNARYEMQIINTTSRKSNRDKGKRDFTMVLAALRYARALIASFARFRPDVVLYTPTTATRIGWVRDGMTLLLCGLFRTRLVMQFRGGHFGHFYHRQPAWIRAVIRWLLRRCHRMLVQADRLQQQFHGILPPEKLGTVPNAIPDDFFQAFDHVSREHRAGPPTILFVGHLSQAKGYCDLLEVMPDLIRKHDARFLLMGVRGVEERNVLVNQATGERLVPVDPETLFQERIVEQGLVNDVEFLGDRVDGEAKHRAFESADVFVLPSYSEGFSRAILEGMAAGLPIVATRVGAAEATMENGRHGHLIQPGDTAALGRALSDLLSHPARRLEMGRHARTRCRERFLDMAVSRMLIAHLEPG